MKPLVEMRHLKKIYRSKSLTKTTSQTVALDDINLEVFSGEILAIIGESGSGKSTLAKLVTGLEKPSGGSLSFAPQSNVDSGKLNVQMVFQDPYACLNPVFPVSQPVMRALQLNHGVDKSEAARRAQDIFESVGLTPAEDMMRRYPHELSGGQRQRVAIARAVATSPDLLIADEPTSMLDVSIRIDILNLLKDLRDKQQIGIMLITHDVASAWYLADRMAVLYSGQLLELGDADQIALDPQHPYTKVLIAASQNRRRTTEPQDKVSLLDKQRPAAGLCKFLPRCIEAQTECFQLAPKLQKHAEGRTLRCLKFEDGQQGKGSHLPA